MCSIDVARIIGKTIARIACMPILMVSLAVSAATSVPLRYQSFNNLKSQTQTLAVKDTRLLSRCEGYHCYSSV